MVTVDPTQLLSELNAFLEQFGPARTIQVVSNLIAMLENDIENDTVVQTLRGFLTTIIV